MLSFLVLFGFAVSPLAVQPEKVSPADVAKKQMMEVAGSAEFLRSVPKHFATLKGMDRAKQRVTLLFEGEAEPRDWPLVSDAEIKVHGWWGRLDQFAILCSDRLSLWAV